VFSALASGVLASQRIVMADAVGCTEKKQKLLALTEFIEDGKVTPVIDRGYPFEEIPAAIRHQEEGHATGKVVVTV
jgi:NADPH:quinone reductase-like Zn-dependent oxidoreductase